MEVLNKENKTNRQSEFEKLLSKDLSQRKFSEGEVIEGVVSKIDNKYVFIGSVFTIIIICYH